jgi:hypothetical protein
VRELMFVDCQLGLEEDGMKGSSKPERMDEPRLAPGIRGQGERMKVRGPIRERNPSKPTLTPPLPCERRGDPYACPCIPLLPEDFERTIA